MEQIIKVYVTLEKTYRGEKVVLKPNLAIRTWTEWAFMEGYSYLLRIL